MFITLIESNFAVQIIGGIVGGIAVILLVLVVVMIVYLKKKGKLDLLLLILTLCTKICYLILILSGEVFYRGPSRASVSIKIQHTYCTS